MDVIKVEKRNEQAKANQLRRSGLVPCCVYGGDLPESISIQMDQQTANRLFHTKRESSQVGLELDGHVIPAQIKEQGENDERSGGAFRLPGPVRQQEGQQRHPHLPEKHGAGARYAGADAL